MNSLRVNLKVVRLLGRRSVKQSFRRPKLIAPLIVLPTLLLAAYSGGASSAPRLPGFPEVDSFFDFVIAGAMLLSAMLAGVMGGTAAATDVQTKFLDRLLAAPVWRSSIVIGRLFGTALMGLVGGLWFLAVGLAFGAELKGGLEGAAVLLVLTSLAAVGFGALVVAVGVKSGDPRAAFGLFHLAIVTVLLSSAFFPRNLLTAPADTIADYNPLSYIAEGLRNAWISDVSSVELTRAFLAIGFLFVIGSALCRKALRHRLAVSN